MQTDLFESAFKCSGIGFALTSVDGKCIKANKALSDILGYSEQELLTLDFMQVTYPDDLPADLEEFSNLLNSNRENYQLEKRCFHKSGSTLYVLLNVSVVKHEDGTPNFFISQVQDITELKRTQEKLQKNANLVALGEMAASIAHEINNPLTIINLHTKALERLIQEPQVDRERLKTFTSKIDETVNRINRIIRSLRKISGDNIKHVSYEDVSVSEIVKDTLGLCLEKFKAEKVLLEVSVPEELRLECNPYDISQVLLNILNNSLYAVKDQEQKVIKIASWQTGPRVFISVTGSGVGIPQEIRAKLLEPFFTTKPPGQGTGLGLSISRSIIQSHGGELYLDEKKKSTTFVFELARSQVKQ